LLIQNLQASSATVDVIPMFFENACDHEIDSEDLVISSPSIQGENKRQTDLSVCIQHLPTGISVQSSGMHMFVFICLPLSFSSFSFIIIYSSMFQNLLMKNAICPLGCATFSPFLAFDDMLSTEDFYIHRHVMLL